MPDNGGYTRGDSDAFDATPALDPEALFAFLQSTQPKKWEKISKIHSTICPGGPGLLAGSQQAGALALGEWRGRSGIDL